MQPPAARPGWSRREALGALGLGAAGLLLTACTKSNHPAAAAKTPTAGTVPTASPSVASNAPTRVLDVTSFGAVGDGSTDDTEAISTALAQLQRGDGLRFPAGKVFCHAKVLSVATAGVSLLGPGTLCATAEGTSALKIEADDITVDGVMLTVPTTTRRWSTPDQHRLFVGGHQGVVVKDVTIQGSAAAGLFSLGASNFEFRNVRVADTRADGIHLTDGSHDGSVIAPVVQRSGDDGVAVVSYLDDAKPCRNITISSPQVHTTTGGRGLSVVGGTGIVYQDITVSDSNAASVYIACEGSSSVTYPTSEVRVTGGSITGANTNSGIDHGAVLIYSGRSDGSVSAVTVSGLTITDTRSGASRQIGVVADHGNPVSAIIFDDLRLAATPTPYQGNAPVSDVTVTATTAAGAAVAVPQ